MSRAILPPAETLSRLASLENKDLSIRDYTIRDIAAADNGSGLPILLECLRDERDRQAIYALKTMLPSMGAEKSLELLSSIKSEKITVFKEVLRLAGEIGSTESYNWLLQQEKTPLHRDARLALLRAVWDYPERQETWELMRKAIASGDQSYADCAIRLPVEHRSSEAKRNKLLIYAEALLSKSVIVRIETLYLIASGSILDPQQLLVAPLSTCLSSPNADECRAASRAATHLYAGRKSEVLSKYIETLSDLPRNLSIYIQQIQMHLSERPDAYRQDLNLISEELIQKPKTLALLISLAGSLMPLEDFYELLVKVEKAGNLHYGNMRAAETALIQPAQNCSAEELEKLEKQLHSESSDRLRRLGLAALCGLAQCAGGWTPARLAKLRDYRKDSSLLVSSAAEFTLPPAEFAVQAAGS